MNSLRPVTLALLLALAAVGAAPAQNTARVRPAALPLPLYGQTPLPPDRLRAQNPWYLSLTGPWRFQLTHGQIVDGRFVGPAAQAAGVAATSYEPDNLPQNAFDGDPATRWCADGGAFPQTLSADLGRARHVTGVSLIWERRDERYRCRLEGSDDGKKWTTLADASAAPGIGDGPLPQVADAASRFVRLSVLGTQTGHWASVREFGIHYAEDGQDAVWRAAKVAPAPPPRADDFTLSAFDDSHWNTLAVPSNWEMAGYSIPTYNRVDDTVGLYRRALFVPKAWAGRRIVWRFDGALDGAEVFVNGKRAGYHESGYTAFDVDLTGLVQPGRRNVFAVRVSKTTPSSDCETGDFQCLGGIFRETALIAVPPTHVSDLTVRTTLTNGYHDATLDADVVVSGAPGQAVAVVGALVGQDGVKHPISLAGQAKVAPDGTALVRLSAPVTAPRLWSAEKPTLYYLVLSLSSAGKPVETVEQRFGFRQVEIKNNVVLWNGRPIKCEGVCRHDEWADKGWALTDAEWNKDLALMKAANVNAIRTSHYNHAARFLELCEEKGFYVLDEVPFCWINQKNNDPAFAPALLARAADTLGRDKNRPCVLSWSLGNENGVGKNSQTVIDWVKAHDATRPAFISQGGYWGPQGQSFQDMHYPTPADVDRYVANDSGKLPAQFSEQPHIFWQREAQDYDPGASDLWTEALQKTWDKVWKSPTILGSFVWEWQNQGVADKFPDKTREFYYGPGHLRQENNKGIVDAYRNPKPEWWSLKMTYSPVVVGARTVSPRSGVCVVPLTNRYSFTDLSELACRWTALRGDAPLRGGTLHVACAPMGQTQASFPAPAGMTELRLEFDRPDGTPVTSARLPAPGAPTPAPGPAPTGGGPLAVQDSPDTLTLSNAVQQVVWDKHSGLLTRWRVRGRDLLAGSPALNLGQSYAGHADHFYAAAQAPVTDGATVTATPAPDGSVRISATSFVFAKTGGDVLGSLVTHYTVQPNAKLTVGWTLSWTAPEARLWEAGLRLPVPATLSQVRWWRDSYFTDYPVGHLGAPEGACRVGDALARASKRGLHWLTLTDAGGTGLALLEADTPLVARADAAQGVTALLASREVAPPQDFSAAWVTNHDITAAPGHPLSGSFILRAVSP